MLETRAPARQAIAMPSPVAPRGAVTPMGTTPRIKPYKVAAVFEIGMSEYDAAFVFMPLKESQAYFNRAGDVTSIEVYTDDPDKVDRYRKLVNDAAGRSIYMVDWRQRNATFFNALQVVRMDAQLRFPAEQRLLLKQTLNLFDKRGVIHHGRLADDLTRGFQRHLHQSRGNHAVQRVQGVLKLADQLLHAGMDRRLLLARLIDTVL